MLFGIILFHVLDKKSQGGQCVYGEWLIPLFLVSCYFILPRKYSVVVNSFQTATDISRMDMCIAGPVVMSQNKPQNKKIYIKIFN